MEIQHGKGPWAPPVSGIVPLGSTLTLVVAINDFRGEFYIFFFYFVFVIIEIQYRFCILYIDTSVNILSIKMLKMAKSLSGILKIFIILCSVYECNLM